MTEVTKKTKRPSDKKVLQEMNQAFSDELFISNVCFSYRHDYGLMSKEEQDKLRFECKTWFGAITNNWEYRKR